MYKVILLFLLTGCSSIKQVKNTPKQDHTCIEAPKVFNKNRSPSSSPSFNIPFDSHIHFYHDTPDFEIIEYMDQAKIHAGLVLATAYQVRSPELIKKSPDYYGPVHWGDPSFRQKTYENTSRFLATTDNLAGLCGVNLKWEDFNIIADQCLKLPKMISLKIHNTHGGKLKKYIPRLQRTLKTTKKMIVLWHPITKHMPVRKKLPFIKNQSIDELTARIQNIKKVESLETLIFNDKNIGEILDVILSNPQHTFIIAHAFQNFFGMKSLLRILRKRNLKVPYNLYFDIAGYLPQTNFLGQYEVNLWREAGLEKFLFGTDYVYPDYVDIKPFIREIINFPFLTLQEKERILVNNGKAFWNKHILTNPKF